MRRSTSRRCVAPCETALMPAEHRAHEPAIALSPPDRHRQDQGASARAPGLADLYSRSSSARLGSRRPSTAPDPRDRRCSVAGVGGVAADRAAWVDGRAARDAAGRRHRRRRARRWARMLRPRLGLGPRRLRSSRRPSCTLGMHRLVLDLRRRGARSSCVCERLPSCALDLLARDLPQAVHVRELLRSRRTPLAPAHQRHVDAVARV